MNMVLKEQMTNTAVPQSIPRITVTSSTDEETSKSHKTAEKIQVRLLTLEEKYRSYLLYQQIKAFEEKVYLSYDNFNVDMLLKMFREMARRCKGARDIYTLAGLRQALQVEIRKSRMRQRNKKSDLPEKKPEEPDQVVQYFIWFFNNLKYLRDLRANFVDRVFNPLFKYFYEFGSTGPDRERSVDSAMSFSNFSVNSVKTFNSHVTGLSSFSGWSQLGLSETGSQESDENIHTTRKKMLARAALLLLGREFRDIKNLYDSTEIEKISHRLSFLKEQLDFLIDNESQFSSEMFSQDSEKAVCHLKVKNSRTYSLMRLIPDILVKFQKAAWLAKRWLELDDMKTKDLNERLQKLAALEGQFSKRLSALSKNIQEHESQLERGTKELQNLLKREDRTSDLELKVHDFKGKISKLETDMQTLNEEKIQLVKDIEDTKKTMNVSGHKNLLTMYERNKLQRYAIERQLAAIRFQENIALKDMEVETEVKPNIMHFTNDVQDRCEELERALEQEKREKNTLQAALYPISKDKEFIAEKLREKQMHIAEERGQVLAKYVGSSNRPEIIAQYVGSSHRPDISFRSLPEHPVDNDLAFNGNLTSRSILHQPFTSRLPPNYLIEGRDSSMQTSPLSDW
ncbi:uncharacterized protein LOC127731233 [Mytilus californianus]|uniref:uncharacterized protein LOC127731233 n=1 Tax=Mytilus californianus TaxID=6549 RepID=UPI002245934B|nr:uncharacterized protein LOC127731233 [Mytilus californianus]